MCKQWMVRAFFLMSLSMALSACHLVGQMDGMAKNTENLKTSTDQVRQGSDELYDSLRQGSSAQLRAQMFKSVLESESTGRKIADAVHFLMAFEYQLFNGNGADQDPAKRELLRAEATQEFFMLLKDIYVPTDRVDVLAQGDPNDIYSNANKEASFNAFSLGLHMLNRKQEENIQRKGLTPVSMYSMIQEALLLESQLGQGTLAIEQVPAFAKHVLNNKKMAIKLLQARHNMFKVVFLGEASPLLQGTNKLAQIYNFGRMNLTGWTLDLEKMPLTQVSEFNQMFILRKATQDLLRSLKIELQTNKWVDRMFQKMTLERLTNPQDQLRQEFALRLQEK